MQRKPSFAHLVPRHRRCQQFKCGARLSLRQKHKIAHVFLKCDDRAEAAQDLASFFETAVEFIKRALKAREAILVHCGQGVSRSASIVIAYAHRTCPHSCSTRAPPQIDCADLL